MIKILFSLNDHKFGYSVSLDYWIFARGIVLYCILFFYCNCCILYICDVYTIIYIIL
jgi:hypothetical protein